MDNRGEGASGVAGSSNVLFLSTAFQPERQDTCVDLLGAADPAHAHVVGVAYTRSAAGWIDEYLEHATERPARMTVVSIGERARATDGATERAASPAGTAAPEGGTAVAAAPEIETIESASDLTELGIALSRILEEHETTGTNDDLVLCFDSLTALLQFVDVQRAFRFLHVMTNRLAQDDARAHYHLDPEAHDDQTIATLKTLFDAIVTVDDDGLNVRRR